MCLALLFYAIIISLLGTVYIERYLMVRTVKKMINWCLKWPAAPKKFDIRSMEDGRKC